MVFQPRYVRARDWKCGSTGRVGRRPRGRLSPYSATINQWPERGHKGPTAW